MSTPKRSPLFLFIVLTFFSCKEDDAKVPAKQCFLTKHISSAVIYTYNRNDKNEVVSIDYNHLAANFSGKALLEYDQEGNLTKIVNQGSYYVYDYHANGTINTEKWYMYIGSDPEPILAVDKRFSYNSQGLLSKVTSVGDYFTEYERYEHDDKGNVIKVYYSKDGIEEYLTKEYLKFDDKKNPSSGQSFYQTIILPFDHFEGQIFFYVKTEKLVNNPLIIKYYDQGKVLTGNFSYTYNEFGYAVEVKGFSTPINYKYNCP